MPPIVLLVPVKYRSTSFWSSPTASKTCAPGVGGDRGDPHLGHDLQDALAERLDVVADGLVGGDAGERAGGDEVLDRLECKVRVHRRRAEAEQHGDVVDLAAVARLDDERDLGARLLPDQMMVDRGGQQERRDRRELGGGVAVGQDEDPGAVLDRLGYVAADLRQPGAQTGGAVANPVEPADPYRPEAGQVPVLVDREDLRQLVVVDHGVGQADLPATGRTRFEQVRLGADGRRDARDQLLPDRVERRIGHLGKQLHEVVVEQPRALAQDGDRRVRSHGANGFDARTRHGREQNLQLLLGVAERLLAPLHRIVGVDDVLAVRQLGQVHEPGVQPLGIRRLGRQLLLDLVVLDDAANRRVDQEHPARLEATLGDHGGRIEIEDARLTGQHDQPVTGLPPPTGTQTVAVQHRPDDRAVRERDARRPVPGLHQAGVELIEGPAVAGPWPGRSPTPRGSS